MRRIQSQVATEKLQKISPELLLGSVNDALRQAIQASDAELVQEIVTMDCQQLTAAMIRIALRDLVKSRVEIAQLLIKTPQFQEISPKEFLEMMYWIQGQEILGLLETSGHPGVNRWRQFLKASTDIPRLTRALERAVCRGDLEQVQFIVLAKNFQGISRHSFEISLSFAEMMQKNGSAMTQLLLQSGHLSYALQPLMQSGNWDKMRALLLGRLDDFRKMDSIDALSVLQEVQWDCPFFFQLFHFLPRQISMAELCRECEERAEDIILKLEQKETFLLALESSLDKNLPQ